MMAACSPVTGSNQRLQALGCVDLRPSGEQRQPSRTQRRAPKRMSGGLECDARNRSFINTARRSTRWDAQRRHHHLVRARRCPRERVGRIFQVLQNRIGAGESIALSYKQSKKRCVGPAGQRCLARTRARARSPDAATSCERGSPAATDREMRWARARAPCIRW
jgi:hypothetical protein